MYKYYKVLNASMTRCGFQYKPGLNDLTEYFNENGDLLVCYFTDIEHIFRYVRYGPLICGVKPKSDKIYDPEDEIPGWYSEKVWLSRPKDIMTVDTFDFLIQQRAIINFDNYNLIKYVSTRSKEVFHYLMQLYTEAGIYDNVKSELEQRGFM